MAYPEAERQRREWMEEVRKTAKLSGLTIREVQKQLKNFTHSELRSGKDFIETMNMKHLTGSKDLLFN